jgi:uncharacterized membrane protein
LIKSIVWRLLGVLVLAIVTYVITRNWIQTGLVTFINHVVFFVIYYLHERVWCRITNIRDKKRKILKAFTYEIVLGHLVLGIISWIITKSWVSATLVTIVCVENKLWIYYVYDWIWDKISWGIVVVN